MMLRRTRTALVQWCVAACMHAATCALAWVVVGVQDHKANTSLTELNLWSNEVGDVGATALAETLKATVLTCTQCAFRTCACCYLRCHFTWRCEQLASSGEYAVGKNYLNRKDELAVRRISPSLSSTKAFQAELFPIDQTITFVKEGVPGRAFSYCFKCPPLVLSPVTACFTKKHHMTLSILYVKGSTWTGP